MKKVNIVTAVQAKAIRAICEGYVSETANKRYREIIKEIETNDVLSTLLHMIGEAMHKEEVELESDIIADLSSECSGNVYFDSYRYCLTQSREMKTTFKRLMGW